ncbi:MAG: GNAT family N-acetyltransferase [Flavobacterium sp.]|nr:GNAT family N-acetyltransferase [Flavobacterium sp.]
MILIKKIYKKNIPELFENTGFWNNEFLSISKHRLLAHYNNPNLENDDIVLLLAYLDNELVGYMGVFIDKITINNQEQKIGWLSTWWVHPKTKGSGIGREILNTMYKENNGKIGISQFTQSAKRVYDKSEYFVNLKQNIGIKAVLKSNLVFLIPEIKPTLKIFKPAFALFDSILNAVINVKLYFNEKSISTALKNIKIEYLNAIDSETRSIINKYNSNHLSEKSNDFFIWLKKYQWVQEAPLLDFTEKSRYEFSMCDESFNIYLMKIIKDNLQIGFIVLQKRNSTMKVLFAYYDKKNDSETVSNIIKLQAIKQNIQEIICYDLNICNNLEKSNIFIYNRKKIKNSIISKAFDKEKFDEIIMNYGDGDCCFA